MDLEHWFPILITLLMFCAVFPYLWKGNMPIALYWLSACMINFSVLWSQGAFKDLIG